MQERPWSPSPSTNLPLRHSVLSKTLAPVCRAIAIRSSSGLRLLELATRKAFDQAAVWLFCAVSSWQWFHGLGVSSRAASESLQTRPSQADCVSFCRGDESWSMDQASVALITSPWGSVREGSNLLTRPWQAKDDDKKDGRDRSAAERRPRPPCRIGRDACDQLSFPKGTFLIFSVYILIAVSNASRSSLHLKHGTLHNRYVSGNWSHPPSEFQSSEWMQDVDFMVDITQHLNNLNKMLQGRKRLVTQYYGTICAFNLKLSLWETTFWWWLGQPKVNKFEIFLLFWKFMKRPQTKFHAHTMRESQVIRSKKSQSQNLSLCQNFLVAKFFPFIDTLLKLQQQI